MTLEEVAKMLDGLYNNRIEVRFFKNHSEHEIPEYIIKAGTTKNILKTYGSRTVDRVLNQGEFLVAFLMDE